MTETGSWMPMYWADYFGDTMHLSTEEHGAYLLLLGTYWRRGKALPDDDKWLATVTKMTTKKWKMVRPKVIEFFEISDGHLYHKRVEKEMVKSSGRLDQARAAGQAGGLATRARVTTTTTESIPDANASGTDEPLQNGQDPDPPDKAVYAYGKQVLGKSAGGLIRQLIEHCDKDLGRAYGVLTTAAGKQDPREYVGATIRAGPRSGQKTGAELLAEVEEEEARCGVDGPHRQIP